MLKVKVIGSLYFSVSAPCGTWWQGMRHSDDVRLIIDRALDHLDECATCKAGS